MTRIKRSTIPRLFAMLLTGVALLHGGQAAASAAGPAGYTRSDGVNSVVYRASDNHIHELYLVDGSGWRTRDLTALTGAALAGGDPHGYARSDGVNSHGADRGSEPEQDLLGGWSLDDTRPSGSCP